MFSPRTTVIIPCFNTSAACLDVIRGAARFSPSIVAVDDGSTDDTAEHLRASGCRVLQLPRNKGKGAALAAGFRDVLSGDAGAAANRAEFVITIDGDGQHDPADIPRLVAQALASGADLVIGMRQPGAMPRKNRIGSHYSRLLFLIGTATFVADTQSGFRLHALPLVSAHIDRIEWKGYESESELLGAALNRGFTVSAVSISTIYLDGNRGSQFSAWRDSSRIAAVFAREITWTVAMAWLDFALFAAIVMTGALGPASANLASRGLAVACHAALRRDFLPRTKRLARREGAAGCAVAFAGHLAATTAMVAGLTRIGVHPILAKGVAQLVGYLGSFAIIDRVLLAKAASR